RLWVPAGEQQRLNAWMLMAGSLGLVVGTLPAERMAAAWGWRALFMTVGALFLQVAVAVAWLSPRQARRAAPAALASGSYAGMARSACMRSIGPLGLFNYAVLVAVQTLWAGPWLTHVGGLGATEAARRLMFINGIVLAVFLLMGWLLPRVVASADDGERLLRRWTPLSVGLLFLIAVLGSDAGWPVFAAYCVCAWPLSVTHPLVAQRFAGAQAGRALAWFNLLLFAGVFFWQWGFGVVVAWLQPVLGVVDAYRLAMLLLALLSAIGYLMFMPSAGPRGPRPQARRPSAFSIF
ncbi:MAG: MFS transporter, partial [Hylemonella sp.]